MPAAPQGAAAGAEAEGGVAGGPGAAPVVALRDVHKRYADKPVLCGATFTVAEGEMVALRGRSGSGKSTLLHLLGGLDRDFTGQIAVCGQDLRGLSDGALARLRNARIGFVFQSFHLLDHLTSLENVLLPDAFAEGPLPAAAARDRAAAALERVGLGDRLRQRPAALSGGQKQRVAIARALFRQPRLLLCDEPTGNLDSHTGEQIIELFRSLNQEGLTLLVVTHEERVYRTAARVLRLEDGAIAEAA